MTSSARPCRPARRILPDACGASCAAGSGLAPRGWAINLAGVDEDTGNDFGNYQQATKTGVKFEDLNANGVKDASEPGLTGWGITPTST